MRQILFLMLSNLIIIADQLSKWFITEHIIRPALGQQPHGLITWYIDVTQRLPFTEIEVLPFFNINMVWNQGVSFGLFSGDTDYGPWLLIALSLFITIWFGAWLFKETHSAKLTGIAMVIGGALGNVIDRVRFGAVIDFLDIHIGDWHYPSFNIADSAIVIGVFVLIIHSLFFEKSLHHEGASG